MYTCNSHAKFKVKDHADTYLDLATAKSLIMAVKSMSRSISDSVLVIARLIVFPELWMFGGDLQFV